MEKRSLFQKIFSKVKDNRYLSRLQMLMGYDSVYTGIGDNEYDQKTARQCIDRIATQVALLEPQHIKGSLSQDVNSQVGFLLQNRPNPVMNTYDFLYKVTSNLYSNKNAFIFIDRNKLGMVEGFYPLLALDYQLYEDLEGKLFLQFRFLNGKIYTLPYLELIHLRLFYNENDIFGTNDDVLKTDLETAHTSSEGIKNAIKTSTALKGILKFDSILKEKDIVDTQTRFVRDYIEMGNKSGIASLDSKAEFQEVNLKPITLDADQLKAVNYNIYDYYGISEKIVRNDFNTNEWNAFYEGVIKPRARQMQLEFTNKIFNKKGIKEGNKIIFSTNLLTYATLDSKVNLIKNASAYGFIKTDEAREILGLAKLGGAEGERILQSLNSIDTTIANEYQVSKKENKD
jgi:HK97 family phage portal protein